MKIHEKHNLKSYNTFGLPVLANYFGAPGSLDEIKEQLEWADKQKREVKILGGGSNVLITRDLPYFIMHPTFSKVEVVDENETHVWVDVDGGLNWHKFVLHCLENGWYGIENLSLIPGNVGAAPIQNIGAYGVEVKELIDTVFYLELESGVTRSVKNKDCDFGYRDSIFKRDLKGKILIYKVRFRLIKKVQVETSYGAIQSELEKMGIASPTPKDVSAAVIAIRQSKLPDPKELGNSGSFFKNPVVDVNTAEELKSKFPNLPNYPNPNGVKLAAGWLIEQAGLKGKRFGNCGVHDKQALVLVNYGQATGTEIWSMAQEVIKKVQDQFGISLEPEVNIW
ncbi:UDP-N-acetylmuramate dehydrogenase [Luteibaculum oceani]|uniref:UDP-N-acetylenolpyruvoylglucosamine reductase n=1 Tax=Luteibaculum oceani TaxID=1294296 RepID=A0A5C6VB94_9FLAO|nr:UDP-N-acetylmuramate dehydrogenase [Luteibaculum oceani]TXC81676.1 UDP-N-acetylmuramate dehydrogenase [Luteibaculum oceani]